MAKKEILLSTCDRCTIESQTPLSKKKKRGEYDLPQGWMHVSGNTATATVFEMDLCSDCKQIVVETAGMSTLFHSSKSKAGKTGKAGKAGKSEADSDSKDHLKAVESA